MGRVVSMHWTGRIECRINNQKIPGPICQADLERVVRPPEPEQAGSGIVLAGRFRRDTLCYPKIYTPDSVIRHVQKREIPPAFPFLPV